MAGKPRQTCPRPPEMRNKITNMAQNLLGGDADGLGGRADHLVVRGMLV